MKKIFPFSLTFILLFSTMPILAQDGARVHDYAILSLYAGTDDGSYGKFLVQYSDNRFDDLTEKLNLPTKKIANEDPVKEGTDFDSYLIKCFDFLDKEGFELVSFNDEKYIFRKPHR